MKTLVIGAAIIDHVIYLDKMPIIGGDIYIENSKQNIGGCAFNVANVLKALKADYDLFTPIGQGTNANLIKATYQKIGHKILCQDNFSDNGFCLAFVTKDGQRTFMTKLGIEDHIKSKWLNVINEQDYQNYYFDGYRLTSKDAIKLVNYLASLKNKKFYFAPGPMIKQIKKSLWDKLFSMQVIIHLNLDELKLFSGIDELERALRWLHQKNNNLVIVTLGAKGLAYIDNHQISYVKTKVLKAIDTIGAGDSHIAAFIAYYDQTNDINIALHKANQIAAKAIMIQGSDFNAQTLGVSDE